MGVWYQSCHYKPCNYERENVAFDMVHFLIHETNDCSIILPTSRIFPYDQQYVKEATTSPKSATTTMRQMNKIRKDNPVTTRESKCINLRSDEPGGYIESQENDQIAQAFQIIKTKTEDDVKYNNDYLTISDTNVVQETDTAQLNVNQKMGIRLS